VSVGSADAQIALSCYGDAGVGWACQKMVAGLKAQPVKWCPCWLICQSGKNAGVIFICQNLCRCTVLL